LKPVRPELLSLQFKTTEWVVPLATAPVPPRATVAVELEALLTRDRLPFTVPEAVGAKLTEKDAL